MPAKAKIKVITEEIKDDKTEKPVVEVATKEDKVEELDTTPQTPKEIPITEADTVDTSKLTSFSTLDVENKAEDPEVPDEKPAEPLVVSKEKLEPETEEKEPEESKDMNSADVKEWLSDVRPDTSKEMEKSGKSGFKIFLIVLLLLVAVGLAAGGVYYYKNSSKTSEEEGTERKQETQAEATQTPEPTKSTVDLKKFTVNVLNGSGITGEAKKVSDLLVTGGFAESKTGNAANSKFTKTEVALKEAVPAEVFDAVKKSLGDTYDVVKAEKAHDSKSTYDIVITVGTKKS